MCRVRTLLVAAAAALALSGSAQADDWQPRFYNPNPLPDDLVLPLPCGGAIVFRPVATPAESNPLADVTFRLGVPDGDAGYLDYIRQGQVLGPFGADGARLYWLGKYEITRDQYAAVMSGTCPQPSMAGREPQVDIGWFAAVEFTARLSQWLIANAADRLPKSAGAPGYVRLPTEAEWEFAARGGAAVSPSQFRESLFPMDGGLEDYAWYKGAQSANNRLNPVGFKKANPLGFYDILGNAEEMVVEPFQMNRVGRLHGQVGGILSKGGSFTDPPERLSSGMRREYAHFDLKTGVPTAFRWLGFRITLTAPVIGDFTRATELQDDWRAASAARQPAVDDALAVLHQLVDATTENETRGLLAGVEAQFKSELAARNEIEARALRSSLMSGTLMLRLFRFAYWGLGRQHDILKVHDRQPRPDDPDWQKQRKSAVQGIEIFQAQCDGSRQQYVETLYRIIEDYSADMLVQQQDLVLQDLRAQTNDATLRQAQRFMSQLDYVRAHPGIKADEIFARALEIQFDQNMNRSEVCK